MFGRLCKLIVASSVCCGVHGSMQLALLKRSNSLEKVAAKVKAGDAQAEEHFVNLLVARGGTVFEENREFIKQFDFEPEQSERLAARLLFHDGDEHLPLVREKLYIEEPFPHLSDACFSGNEVLVCHSVNKQTRVKQLSIGTLCNHTLRKFTPLMHIEGSFPDRIVSGEGCFLSMIRRNGTMEAWLSTYIPEKSYLVSEIVQLPTHQWAWNICASANSRYFAAGMGNYIVVIDSKQNEFVKIENALLGAEAAEHLFFSPHNQWLVLVTESGIVRGWLFESIKNAAEHGVISKHDVEYRCNGSIELVSGFNEKEILVASVYAGNREVVLLDLEKTAIRKQSYERDFSGQALCFNRHVCGQLVIALEAGGGEIIDHEGGQRLLFCNAHLIQACFHPKDYVLIALADDGNLYGWDLSNNSSEPAYIVSAPGIRKIVMCPEGDYLLGLGENSMRIWNWRVLTRCDLSLAFLAHYYATIKRDQDDGLSIDGLLEVLDSGWLKPLREELKYGRSLVPSRNSYSNDVVKMTADFEGLIFHEEHVQQKGRWHLLPKEIKTSATGGKNYISYIGSSEEFELPLHMYGVKNEGKETWIYCDSKQAQEGLAHFMEYRKLRREETPATRKGSGGKSERSTLLTRGVPLQYPLFDAVRCAIKGESPGQCELPAPSGSDDVYEAVDCLLKELSILDSSYMKQSSKLEKSNVQDGMKIEIEREKSDDYKRIVQIRRLLLRVVKLVHPNYLRPVVNKTIKNCGKSLLHYAVEAGAVHIVRKLRDCGALQIGKEDPLKPTGEVVIPFIRAVTFGWINIVKDLQQEATDISPSQLVKAIFEAAFNGHLQIFKHLCVKGIPFDASLQDYSCEATSGWSLLHYAAAGPNVEIFEYCINIINIPQHTFKHLFELYANRQRMTPFEIAAWYGRTKNVEVLLRTAKMRGMDVRKGYGDIAFIGACSAEEGLPVVRLLAEDHKELLTSGTLQKGLCAAAGAGNLEIVTYLLKSKATVNDVDGNGDTPLHCAVRHGKLLMVKELLSCGANVYAKNSAGETPESLINASKLDNAEELNRMLNTAGEDQQRPNRKVLLGKRRLYRNK